MEGWFLFRCRPHQLWTEELLSLRCHRYRVVVRRKGGSCHHVWCRRCCLHMLIHVAWKVVFANTLWCLQAYNLLEEVVDLKIFQDVGNTHDPHWYIYQEC